MSETRFFNVWRTTSKENQEKLIQAMRDETSLFQSKPGFLELVLWQGEADDHRVLADGRWASRADFEAAVANNQPALEGRKRMAQFGTPEAGLFRETFRVQPALHGTGVSGRELPNGIAEHGMEVNGQSIHYLRAGAGPLMLLAHGYPESSRTWLKVIPELAKHFTVIAPDTRSTGDSSVARNFTIKDVADDLYELVQALGFRELILVGQDFGVQVVGAYAALHREDIQAFVAIESPLSGFGLEDLFGSFWHFGFLRSPIAEMLIQGREGEFFRAFAFGDFVYQKSAFSERDIDEYVQNQVRPGRLAAGFDYYRALGNSKEFFEKTVAPPWRFPVLAMDGDHSMSGLTARSFARIQPGLKSMLIPDCGHFVQEEQPEFLVRTLLNFTSEFRQ
jgi:pimeloyl-ACP methyl ester carboxylesterase/heme-degrading monooxygenase HmoA